MKLLENVLIKAMSVLSFFWGKKVFDYHFYFFSGYLFKLTFISCTNSTFVNFSKYINFITVLKFFFIIHDIFLHKTLLFLLLILFHLFYLYPLFQITSFFCLFVSCFLIIILKVINVSLSTTLLVF